MRILIVTHYFPPETGAPQARLSGARRDLGRRRGRGHRAHRDAQPPHRRAAAGSTGGAVRAGSGTTATG